MKKLEALLELGGIKKDVTLLALSGAAVMTGESLPVDKTAGDEVSSGAINQFGAFDRKVTKVGEDSSIQRMIRLVQSADAGKAKIVGLADRFATWVVVIALTAAGLTWAISGEIIRAVTILVVFCPCALVLATPTAIMAAIGNATKHGFLVREGDALERLAGAKVLAFDKTGTLTLGTPEVTQVLCADDTISEDVLLRLAAAAEQRSEHPLGKAIVRGFQKAHADTLPQSAQFRMVPGRGVCTVVDGRTVLAGNPALLEDHSVSLLPMQAAEQAISTGSTVTYAAVDGRRGFCAGLAFLLVLRGKETAHRKISGNPPARCFPSLRMRPSLPLACRAQAWCRSHRALRVEFQRGEEGLRAAG